MTFDGQTTGDSVLSPSQTNLVAIHRPRRDEIVGSPEREARTWMRGARDSWPLLLLRYHAPRMTTNVWHWTIFVVDFFSMTLSVIMSSYCMRTLCTTILWRNWNPNYSISQRTAASFLLFLWNMTFSLTKLFSFRDATNRGRNYNFIQLLEISILTIL